MELRVFFFFCYHEAPTCTRSVGLLAATREYGLPRVSNPVRTRTSRTLAKTVNSLTLIIRHYLGIRPATGYFMVLPAFPLMFSFVFHFMWAHTGKCV